MGHTQDYELRLPKPEETEAIAAMHAQLWRETYPNEAAGVTHEWVEERVKDRILSSKGFERRLGYLARALSEPEHLYYRVAVSEKGEVLGHVIAEKTEEKQELLSIYVTKARQGTGLAQRMFDELLQWFDAERPVMLEVVDYNQRAIGFYEKQGFKRVPGSEFRDLMPSLWMKKEINE